MHRSLVTQLGCALISIDYRLAPETVFPGAIEDCYAALAWVFRHADALGIDAARIGVTGESAGGAPPRWRCWHATAANTGSRSST